MSLFRFIEAYSYNVPNSSTFAIGKLCTGDREQIVIGGEDGLITVIDPTISPQSSKESFLAQHQTDDPVIQVAIGNFLQYPDPVVAVLHTTSLAHYTLRYDEQDPANTSFQLAFTHDIGEPAHCMCVVDDEQHPQILVETVSCRLHLFQGDQCLFSRASLPALFPGPIAYHRLTSSLNIACGYHIYSVKFSLLSSLSNNGKKISFDWSFNCGDWPLQVFAVDHLPAQPSVLVVARRNIFCLPATEPDRIRWQVRLETIAISAHAYRCDDETDGVRYLVATASNTLLVFKDNQLLWNCQADFSPIAFCRSSLNSSCQHMLALLSVDGRVTVGYLGTEPHLFKPSHDNRVRDFKEMVDELRDLEKTIGGGPALPITGALKNLTLSFEVESDKNEPVSRGEVPRILVRVVFQGVPTGNTVELSVCSPLTYTTRYGSGESIGLDLRVGSRVPWTTVVDVVAVCSPSQVTCVSKFRLLLNNILAEATPDRNSDLKITFELDRHTIPLNELFPEFHTENPSSIAFQPYGPCDSTVIRHNKNSDRYRIQSDKIELLALISRELVDRLKTHDANISLNSRAPLEYLQTRVEKQIEVEETLRKISAELERASLELRAIQALVISKTHNTKHANMDHIDLLYKTSHGKMLEMIEMAIGKKNAKEELENELCAVFDIITLIGGFSKQETLVDGHFYGNTQQVEYSVSRRNILQTLVERLAWATKKTDITEALETLCQHTSKVLPQIAEEEQEEDYESPEPYGVPI